MKKTLILMLSCIACPFAAQAQSDFDLTQRWFNESLYNPAAAGNSFSSGVFLHACNQWVGMEGAPTTLAASFDTWFPDMSSGFGLSFSSDKIGLTTSYSGRLFYAYYIRTGARSVLSAGLSAGLFARETAPGEADNPIDPALAALGHAAYSPDFDFGLEFKGPFKLGVSVRHVGTRFTANNRYLAGEYFSHSLNIWAYLSSRFNLSSTLSIEPMCAFTIRDNIYRYEIGGLLYFMKSRALNTYSDRFWAGIVYRTSHNLAFLAGMNITPKLRLGYSFGHGLGDISSLAKFGTHEIFLAFYFHRIFYKEPACPAYR